MENNSLSAFLWPSESTGTRAQVIWPASNPEEKQRSVFMRAPALDTRRRTVLLYSEVAPIHDDANETRADQILFDILTVPQQYINSI